MQLKWEERWYRCETDDEYQKVLYPEVVRADVTYKEHVTDKMKYLYFQPSWGKQ